MESSDFSVSFFTLGCRLNQLETEEIALAFRSEGFITEKLKPFDLSCPKAASIPLICIINTCAVTAKAEQKARRVIRLALKGLGGGFAAVIVTGCYAQTDAKKIRKIESGSSLETLIVLPGKIKNSLKSLARQLKAFIEDLRGFESSSPAAIKGMVASFCRDFCLKEEVSRQTLKSESPSQNTPARVFTPLPAQLEKHLSPLPKYKHIKDYGEMSLFSFHSRAAVKIQDGCSSACTFCKTRIARGPSVSVPSNEIIERVRQIEKAGWGEVVLTGVNLYQYKDPVTGAGFSSLLQMLLDSTERIFIRISSLYPESVTPEFARVVSSERICPFFHLSIQSASEKIIDLMGRNYKPSQITEAVSILRTAKDEPFVSCDVIAGFPGETEEDFKMTEELCLKLNFAHIHAFPFSPREGTLAANMKGQVPQRIVRERVRRLEAISSEGKRRYYELWKGKTLSGIFEYSSETKKTNVFTVNALSIPLEYSEFLSTGGKNAEFLQGDLQRLRGAPVLVKIHGIKGSVASALSLAASLKAFLY